MESGRVRELRRTALPMAHSLGFMVTGLVSPNGLSLASHSDPGIELQSPELAGRFFTTAPAGSPANYSTGAYKCFFLSVWPP